MQSDPSGGKWNVFAWTTALIPTEHAAHTDVGQWKTGNNYVISLSQSIWAVSCGSHSSLWSEQLSKHTSCPCCALLLHTPASQMSIYPWLSGSFVSSQQFNNHEMKEWKDEFYFFFSWCKSTSTVCPVAADPWPADKAHGVLFEQMISQRKRDWRSTKLGSPDKTCPHILNPF